MKKLNLIGDRMLDRVLGTTDAAAGGCEKPPYYDFKCIDGLRYRRTCHYDQCERRTICGPFKYTGHFC